MSNPNVASVASARVDRSSGRIIAAGSNAANLYSRYYGCAGTYSRLVSVTNDTELANALTDATAGDRISLAPGVNFTGPYVITASGSSSSRIVLCTSSSDPATIQFPGAGTGRFRVQGDYVSLYGIEFLGSSYNDVLIWWDGGNFGEIIGCELHESGGNAGMSVDDVEGFTVAYNYIHHNGVSSIQHGIYWRANNTIGSTAARSYCVRNIIAFNQGRGISYHDNSNLPNYNVSALHNTIVGNGEEGILVAMEEGYGNLFANNVLAFNSRVHTNQQFRYKSGRTIEIYNNVAYDSTAANDGIQYIPDTSYSSTDVTYTNNLDTFDPLFTSLTMSGTPGRGNSANDTGNFHLQSSSSPAVDLGLDAYSVSPDYDDVSESSPFDAGALRFV